MKDIRFYFDKAVNTYEQAGLIQKKVANYLLEMIPTDFYQIVVEIGSGRGFVTKNLIDKISFEKYINIDISFELLKKLGEILKDRCVYINAKAENIPLKSNSVDLLISSSSLHWLEDSERNFLDILKLIKENGRFYFSIFLSNTLIEIQEVSKITGFGSFYPLKSSFFYINLLNSMGDIKYSYSTKVFIEKFSSVKDLLNSHKLTGTNFTTNKRFSGKNSYNKFCEIYQKLYGNGEGIYATYEVLFIEGQKISLFHQD